jgi:hypothetical protein
MIGSKISCIRNLYSVLKNKGFTISITIDQCF